MAALEAKVLSIEKTLKVPVPAFRGFNSKGRLRNSDREDLQNKITEGFRKIGEINKETNAGILEWVHKKEMDRLDMAQNRLETLRQRINVQTEELREAKTKNNRWCMHYIAYLTGISPRTRYVKMSLLFYISWTMTDNGYASSLAVCKSSSRRRIEAA